ncbi:MAG TPA: response regulator [Candidatus Angelobacter sp.]|nr:response regulator [Candidatus Angelobacter sp.]
MKRKILVVDDDEFIAEALRLILEVYGYTTQSAHSASQAVAQAQEFRPDLLLSDVMMPGMNGFEAGALIKRHCPDCFLLFFSGHTAEPEFSRMSDDLKGKGYSFEVLRKPLDPGLLLDRIIELLGEGTDPGA